MSEKQKWLLAAAILLGVIVYLYKRSSKASAAAAGTDISSPIAKGVRYVTDNTDSIAGKAGVVGKTAAKVITGAPGNVLKGDTTATIWSAATGGLSDLISVW